jgi:hypothetical protein
VTLYLDGIREKKRLKWIGNELIMMERNGI